MCIRDRISAAVDIGIQVTTNTIEGKPADDIDWVSVGAAAVDVYKRQIIFSCKIMTIFYKKSKTYK